MEAGEGVTASGVQEVELDGAQATLFSEGDALYEAMLNDVATARERVWIESYIFADDAVGREFVKQLTGCAQRGVDVRIRVDALGSRLTVSGGCARRLRASGVDFRWSLPWQWRRPWTYHRRNHRKLAVVDDRAAYLGGFNVAAVNSRRAFGPTRWRDTHLRLSGQVVDEAATAYVSFGRGDLSWQCRSALRGLQLLTNHSRRCRFRLRCELHQQIDHAAQRVWLTTPYFVPDSATQRHLCEAALRGVDVRVLVPGKGDVALVQWAGRAAYSRLLQSGVQIFEYLPRMLHAKTMLVDDAWSTVGTANFDYRSFFLNYELNLMAWSGALNAALARLFEWDLRQSEEIRSRPWRRRAVAARSAEVIGWCARHWL